MSLLGKIISNCHLEFFKRWVLNFGFLDNLSKMKAFYFFYFLSVVLSLISNLNEIPTKTCCLFFLINERELE